MQAVDLGPQTDTAHFAAWEEHTRGIGSKLMAGMGYISGRGLGSSRPGRVAPLEVSTCLAAQLQQPGLPMCISRQHRVVSHDIKGCLGAAELLGLDLSRFCGRSPHYKGRAQHVLFGGLNGVAVIF